MGAEVAVPLFQRAKPGPVALNPVARFSPEGPVSFGYYPASQPLPAKNARAALPWPLGTLGADQNQTLNPDLEGEGSASFDAGDAPFGVWIRRGTQPARFSEDRRNPEDKRNPTATKHVMRIYPLRTRGGDSVPDAFLIAADEGGDGDYQDCVFVLWNAKAAPAPKQRP
jgi:hypothetical protein